MLVYGDRIRRETAGALLERIEAMLADAEAAPLWIVRHEQRVAALIEAGRLAQGLADAAFAARGLDDRAAAPDAAMSLCRRLAEAVMASLQSTSSGTPAGGLDEALQASNRLRAAAALAEEVEVKTPEGYAYYALYPETYGLAARGVEAPAVLGLRSIGTSLAAMAAAGSGAETLVTARPCGHPFARELKLSPELAAELAGGAAVIDEGPGLSGSSFGAAADLLERIGVPPERQWYFPSHLGEPGSMACEQRRERWASLRKRHITFEAFALKSARPLASWFEDQVGQPTGPLEDLSGGLWRARLGADAPVHAAQARRKYLLHTNRGDFLLKFSGLGTAASDKVARAEALHAAGFIPEPLALRHGFLLQRWEGTARPLPSTRLDREALMDVLGRYLAFRAERFPARAEDGATPAELVEMAAYNAGLLLGEAASAPVRARLSPLASARLKPVRIDGRMHAWEWLVLPDGQILKADALDHDDAHDLVGCQDILWDLAGAQVELGLTPREAERLCARLGAEPSLLPAFEVAYLAFQAGAWTLALDGAAAADRPAIERLLTGYRARLAQRLA